MKLTTPACEAPGYPSAGIICSQMASTVEASRAEKKRQYAPPPARPHDTRAPAAVAPTPIARNLRRSRNSRLAGTDDFPNDDFIIRRTRATGITVSAQRRKAFGERMGRSG